MLLNPLWSVRLLLLYYFSLWPLTWRKSTNALIKLNMIHYVSDNVHTGVKSVIINAAIGKGFIHMAWNAKLNDTCSGKIFNLTKIRTFPSRRQNYNLIGFCRGQQFLPPPPSILCCGLIWLRWRTFDMHTICCKFWFKLEVKQDLDRSISEDRTFENFDDGEKHLFIKYI